MASSILLRSLVGCKGLQFHRKINAGKAGMAPSRYVASAPRCSVSRSSSSASLVERRSANYIPTLWDNNYIQSLTIDFKEEDALSEIDKLKEDTRLLLISRQKKLIEQLELVDKLQQLGVSYHFENEIKDVFANIFERRKDILRLETRNDLYATSLLFRLLRGHGFHLPEDVFDQFKDESGRFIEGLSNDVKGILSLYEASFLAVEGENQMDENRHFATEILQDRIKSLVDPLLKEHVAYALELPLHLRMERIHTRWFIDMYEREVDMNATLLRLAKLDFNMVQANYKRELKECSSWWMRQNILENLGFARDRLVENFLWGLGAAFEPKFSRARIAMAMGNTLITTIDDIYDVYGTLEELELFTDCVERWDASAIEILPDYMKICIMSLFNTINDIVSETLKLNGVDTLPLFKKAWTILCKGYLKEARWYHEGYWPTFNEYLENAWYTIGGIVVIAQAYCTSPDLTNDSLECLNVYPQAFLHAFTIFRLTDDLGTATAELERGDVPKAIQCYMHEFNVSEAIAREHIKEINLSSWKRLNGEYICNSGYTSAFTKVLINLPRTAHCIYQYGDGYGDPRQETKDLINALVIDPMQL